MFKLVPIDHGPSKDLTPPVWFLRFSEFEFSAENLSSWLSADFTPLNDLEKMSMSHTKPCGEINDNLVQWTILSGKLSKIKVRIEMKWFLHQPD